MVWQTIKVLPCSLLANIYLHVQQNSRLSKLKVRRNYWYKCNLPAEVGFWLENKCPQFDSRTRRDNPPRFDFLQFPALWDKKTHWAGLLSHYVRYWLLTNMAELSWIAITSQSTLFHRTCVVGSYYLLLLNLRNCCTFWLSWCCFQYPSTSMG